MVQSQVNAGQKEGPTTGEQDELKRLRAEDRGLKEANDILKAASIFLSSGSSTTGRALICRFIGEQRADGCAAESICAVLRLQGVQSSRMNLPGRENTVAGPSRPRGREGH